MTDYDGSDEGPDAEEPMIRTSNPDEPTEAESLFGPGHSDPDTSSGEEPLRFADETGPLPHWTDPPTGEVPKILLDDATSEDLSAWAGFAGQAPVWRDDTAAETDGEDDFAILRDPGAPLVGSTDPVGTDDLFRSFDDLERRDEAGYEERHDDPPVFAATGFEAEDVGLPPSALRGVVAPDPASPEVGTPSDEARSARVTPIRTTRRGNGPPPPPRRAAVTDVSPAGRGTRGRDMPTAIAVGVVLAALFLALAKAGPRFLMVVIVAVLALSAVEFFDTVRRQTYQPATLVGLAAVVGMPLAAYWRGVAGLPPVMFLAVIFTLVWFVWSGSIDSNPLPNSAVTIFGVVYIGMMGSFAALIIRPENPNGVGTLIAVVLATVAYDIAGLLVGSSVGRSPLVGWISPHKTWEGLIGGCAAALIVGTVIVPVALKLHPWHESLARGFQLGLVVAIAAPLGDLAESMLKRNLGVKDMGSLLPGHGGALDRFDNFLFVLPSVYYLAQVLNVH